MKNLMTKALLPLLALTMMACGGTPESPSDSESLADSSSVFIGNEFTLKSALSWFGETGQYKRSFNFFDGTTPTADSFFTEIGCLTNYKNFSFIAGTAGQGYINVDSELASKKGIEEGVYNWTSEYDLKEDGTPKSSTHFELGAKISGATKYQDLFNTPAEIAANSAAYEAALEPEIEGQKNGYYFLNKSKPNADLLESFAKSLGVYDTITGAGLTLNYAMFYFGATTKNVQVNFYARLGDGYDMYNTSVNCLQFGEATISNLNKYIAG